MISYLLVYICSSALGNSCAVWSEGSWSGPQASLYCQAERDRAEQQFERDLLRGRNDYGTEHVRFECQSTSTGDGQHD